MGSQSTMRRRFILGMATALGGALAGCSAAEDEFGGGDGGGGVDREDVDADATVVVAPDGEQEFDPHSLEIDPGDTVEFVWESRGHTLSVNRKPEESSWEGVRSAQEAEYVHAHTFEVEGLYWYYCAIHAEGDSPHDPAENMEGEIIVGDVDPDEVIEEEEDEEEGDDDARQPYSSVSITDADPDENTIELYHAGGDPLPADEVTITVSVRGTDVLDASLHEAIDDLDEDSAFQDGDTAIVSLDESISEGDEIVVTLYHEPTDSVVSEISYRRW